MEINFKLSSDKLLLSKSPNHSIEIYQKERVLSFDHDKWLVYDKHGINEIPCKKPRDDYIEDNLGYSKLCYFAHFERIYLISHKKLYLFSEDLKEIIKIYTIKNEFGRYHYDSNKSNHALPKPLIPFKAGYSDTENQIPFIFHKYADKFKCLFYSLLEINESTKEAVWLWQDEKIDNYHVTSSFRDNIKGLMPIMSNINLDQIIWKNKMIFQSVYATRNYLTCPNYAFRRVKHDYSGDKLMLDYKDLGESFLNKRWTDYLKVNSLEELIITPIAFFSGKAKKNTQKLCLWDADTIQKIVLPKKFDSYYVLSKIGNHLWLLNNKENELLNLKIN